MRLATGGSCLLLDLEDHIHDRIGKVGLGGRAQQIQIGFGEKPTGLKPRKRRGCVGGFEIQARLLGAVSEPVFCLGEGGGDATVALGIGNVATEWIGVEN